MWFSISASEGGGVARSIESESLIIIEEGWGQLGEWGWMDMDVVVREIALVVSGWMFFAVCPNGGSSLRL